MRIADAPASTLPPQTHTEAPTHAPAPNLHPAPAVQHDDAHDSIDRTAPSIDNKDGRYYAAGGRPAQYVPVSKSATASPIVRPAAPPPTSASSQPEPQPQPQPKTSGGVMGWLGAKASAVTGGAQNLAGGAVSWLGSHFSSPQAAGATVLGAYKGMSDGVDKVGGKIDSWYQAGDRWVSGQRDKLAQQGTAGKVLSWGVGFEQGVADSVYQGGKGIVQLASGAGKLASPLAWAADPKGNAQLLDHAAQSGLQIAKLTTPAGWMADPKGNATAVENIARNAWNGFMQDPSRGAGNVVGTLAQLAIPGAGEAGLAADAARGTEWVADASRLSHGVEVVADVAKTGEVGALGRAGEDGGRIVTHAPRGPGGGGDGALSVAGGGPRPPVGPAAEDGRVATSAGTAKPPTEPVEIREPAHVDAPMPLTGSRVDLSKIEWSPPIHIDDVRANPDLLPKDAGVYAWTNHADPIVDRNGVEYVGESKNIRERFKSYVADPASLKVMSQKTPGKVSSALKHAGKSGLMTQMQQNARLLGDSRMWVRYVLTPDRKALEDALIHDLRPAFNTKGLPR